MKNNNFKNVVVVGAGSAGLGVAYELSKNGIRCEVFDKNKEVGGLARSFEFRGHVFDIGPHRFFTKNDEVLSFWKNILGDDFLKVKRLTRIYYKNKFFYYPIQFLDAFKNLGFFEGVRIFFSYIMWKIKFAYKIPKNFEEWMIKNFGRRLYEIFFKTYTEKVWGIPCNELGPEWATQRIKNLSLIAVIKNFFFRENKSKTLTDEFYYPKRGAGMLYEKMKVFIESNGSRVVLNSRVKNIYHKNNYIEALDVDIRGKIKRIKVDYLFSSAPITFLVSILTPRVPDKIFGAAKDLYYRDHITVNLIAKKTTNIFQDQWIYVHDSRVKMARVSNYANFYDENLRDTVPLSVEYFCFREEDLWKMPDVDLIELAKKELDLVGLIDFSCVSDGFVVREADSYPTYYTGHGGQFLIIKNYLSKFSNLQLIGRAGMYKYNNQDHALLTGFLAARNFMGEENDILSINAEDEYLEVGELNKYA